MRRLHSLLDMSPNTDTITSCASPARVAAPPTPAIPATRGSTP
ncbi:hypothetical protein Q3V23_35820 [Streptomyces sp. VNUA116]|nr:hypothetical protein [Streptomyces sp. VNUA116]WKU49008.1 hypothetical protein Q3V23_35820 [Streptomyces sp. VNUA116]